MQLHSFLSEKCHKKKKKDRKRVTPWWIDDGLIVQILSVFYPKIPDAI